MPARGATRRMAARRTAAAPATLAPPRIRSTRSRSVRSHGQGWAVGGSIVRTDNDTGSTEDKAIRRTARVFRYPGRSVPAGADGHGGRDRPQQARRALRDRWPCRMPRRLCGPVGDRAAGRRRSAQGRSAARRARRAAGWAAGVPLHRHAPGVGHARRRGGRPVRRLRAGHRWASVLRRCRRRHHG